MIYHLIYIWVKLVKIRLRKEQLESLSSSLLSNCEKGIKIDIEEAIHRFGCSSDILKSQLVFKKKIIINK